MGFGQAHPFRKGLRFGFAALLDVREHLDPWLGFRRTARELSLEDKQIAVILQDTVLTGIQEVQMLKEEKPGREIGEQ